MTFESFRRLVSAVAVSSLLAVPLALGSAGAASAAVSPVGLGVLGAYAVLGGSAVTNTGPSVLSGNLGVSPGTSITGFDLPNGPGLVTGGSIYGPPDADGARAAVVTAYNDAAGRTGTTVAAVELGGKTLVSGVYTAGSSGTFGLTSTLTLTGDADDVWVFQTNTTLITGVQSKVVLSGGAQACNVYWKVGSSATLGATSTFVGTVLAAESITLGSGVAVNGRLLSGTGAVTLINDVITRSTCATNTDAEAAAAAAAAAAKQAQDDADAAAAAAQAAADLAEDAEDAAALAEADALAAAAAAAQAAIDAAAQTPGSPEADAAAAAAQAASDAADAAAAVAAAATTAAAAARAAADAATDVATVASAAAASRVAAAEEAAGLAALALSARAELAKTGSSALPIAGISLLVLLLGAVMLLYTGRQRRLLA